MDETQFTAEAQRTQRIRRGYGSSSNTLCVSSALSAPAAVDCLSILNILVLLDFNLRRPHITWKVQRRDRHPRFAPTLRWQKIDTTAVNFEGCSITVMMRRLHLHQAIRDWDIKYHSRDSVTLLPEISSSAKINRYYQS